MELGVCYYPEHWPEEWWSDDARAMVAMGISLVRIGEFAWGRIEPEPGNFDWEWLDRAIETLGNAGLKIILGTPTATPPKWLVDRDPTMLAVDRHGRARGFGSRRHYCFSSQTYRMECARIVDAMAKRYGQHRAIVMWQTDNEFGCHDTTISYSDAAQARFRIWLAARYGTVAALNAAWGTVFWSQEYRSFDEVDAPIGTVTEANPSHRLDYNRFASDEVASFNALQVDILRAHSPGRDITHNFMGFYTEFDHFKVGKDLDIATWDSYPLGFLEQFWFSPEEKTAYLHQGHPDIAAFHHDLYRGCGSGRWGVMEQQPGPVNWARYNPAPLPGMVRLWTWEAFAHGAEFVSYFRWRQVPFGQEQMHAGLTLPSRQIDIGGKEARQVADELKVLGTLQPCAKASVALVFSYEGDWLYNIHPQGAGFSLLRFAFEMYSALRRFGLDIDIVPPNVDLSGYKAVFIPSLPIVEAAFVEQMKTSNAVFLCGPRTGSKTTDCHIPNTLPPGLLQSIIPLSISRVESFDRHRQLPINIGTQQSNGHSWREWIDTDLEPKAIFVDGGGAWFCANGVHYLGTWPDTELLDHVVEAVLTEAGVTFENLPDGVRVRRRDGIAFAVNYAAEARPTPAPQDAVFLLGSDVLPAAGLAAWRIR